jgi:hypothetical protein
MDEKLVVCHRKIVWFLVLKVLSQIWAKGSTDL